MVHDIAHLDQLFQEAKAHHRAKRWSDAERLYQAVLRVQSRHAEANYHLGLLATEAGKQEAALSYLRSALEASPGNRQYWLTYAETLMHAGKAEEAKSILDQGIRHGPLAELLISTKPSPASRQGTPRGSGTKGARTGELMAQAVRHHQAGRVGEAEGVCRRILSIDGRHAASLHLLGVLAYQTRRLERAAKMIGEAIAVDGCVAEFHCNLGSVLYDQGKVEEAVRRYEKALAIRPKFPEALISLGNALRQQGRLEEAVVRSEQALALDPASAEAHANLGTVLYDKCRLVEAAHCFHRAIAIQPGFPSALYSLGNVLKDQGKPQDAVFQYDQAIAIQPDFPEAHFNKSLALLLLGDLAAGWPAYEWRRRGGVRGLKPRRFDRPQWDGQPLGGRTILLHPEQGHGDVLQFSRYATLVAARGGRVVLEAYRPLVRLLRTVPGVAEVVSSGESLPSFDVHLPLMSAPLVFGTTVDSIPATVPYMQAEPAATAAWAGRLAGLRGLKVGLVWAGNPRPDDPDANAIDRRRSIRLAQLAPLLAMPGATFVSLQKGDPAAQIADIPPARRPLDMMAEIEDFADTAGLVANLDLVISVDTSVAHLAGAMAKPVWILSRFDGCWRWLQDRDDSPWYPTARLFRQRAPGDWDEVVERVSAVLRQKSAGR